MAQNGTNVTTSKIAPTATTYYSGWGFLVTTLLFLYKIWQKLHQIFFLGVTFVNLAFFSYVIINCPETDISGASQLMWNIYILIL